MPGAESGLHPLRRLAVQDLDGFVVAAHVDVHNGGEQSRLLPKTA